MEITVRYFAGARAAVGVPEESISLPPDATVDDALSALVDRHGDALSRVLRASSFLLDGVAVRDRTAPVGDRTGLDVLPPFAGG
ncbi:MoaD/ThiS family protein [Actinokineospora sp. HUAS TT18]|uniref:MoaD/ThiS family protein n=1 Tax=Actinokineospora sp. HUAS TT18 TaxID=3447451 RepID=UPI003F51C688